MSLVSLFLAARVHGNSTPPDATLEVERDDTQTRIVARHGVYVRQAVVPHVVPVRTASEPAVLSSQAILVREQRAVVSLAYAIIDAERARARYAAWRQ